MRKYMLLLAIIATMILSSCYLFQPIVDSPSEDGTKTVTDNVKDNTWDENTSTNQWTSNEQTWDIWIEPEMDYTDAEIAAVSEKGTILYVDEACDMEQCDMDYVKEIVEWQLLAGQTVDIKEVNITDEIWDIFSKNMSGSPILAFDAITVNDIMASNPGIESYIKVIGDKAFLMLGNWWYKAENLCSDGIDNNGDGKVDLEDSTCTKITILYDSRCDEGELCDTDYLIENLNAQTFDLGFWVDSIDYTTDEWKALYNLYGGKLPVVFSSDLPVDMKQGLDDAGLLEPVESDTYSYILTFLPSTWDPSGEICNNEIDDDGNGQIDCADTACSSKSQCRAEEKGKLEVFLMGYCPYGEIAAEQIPALREALGANLNLDIHFIATHNGTDSYTSDDFDSLHGVPEAEEDIRQLCIKKYYGIDKLVDYMQTRYENANNYGQVEDEPSIALEAIGADIAQISDCVVNGEWGKLLAEDVKIASDLGISASPTWFANNRYEFGGIEANSILSQFCKYNPELEACASGVAIDWDAGAAADVSCE